MSSTHSALLVVAGAVVAMGCDSCRRDRPYVPFSVDASVTTATSAPSPQPSIAPSAAEAPITVTMESRKLEPPSGRFQVGARQLELSRELLAERILELPAADPNQASALVWVVPAKADAEWNGPMGELRWFPAGGDSKKVLDLPAFVPSGPGCTLESRLARLGTTTALVDVHAKCERSLPQRTPTRVLAVITLEPSPAVLLGLRVAEPAIDESITISALVADRDGDGREDPSFRFDFDVLSSQVHAHVALGWLDRTAGASMDEGFFSSSLESTLLAWGQNLKKKALLGGLLAEISAMRRLIASVCQQSAVPRILDWRGEALRCPAIEQVATRLARLEVSAALGQSDPLEAAHAWKAATTWLSGLSAGERKALRSQIAKALKAVPSLPVPVSAPVAASVEIVRYSPLRFEADGSLLIQTGRGPLTRIATDGSSSAVEGDAAAAVIWPLVVAGPDGRRWSSVVPACDRSELSLALNARDGSLLPLVPTRLLAPRPGVCRSPTSWPVTVGPIAWQGESPVAIIDGACWSGSAAHPCASPAKLGPVTPGSPRSPDGQRLIAVTAVGPIVLGGPKPELWTGPNLDDQALTDCVVADNALAIACITKSGAVVLSRRPIETVR